MASAKNINLENEYKEKMISVLNEKGEEKKYLEVKYRNDWFKKENPDGVVKFTLLICEPSRVVAKADVYKKNGEEPIATDFGSAEWSDSTIGRRVVENAVTKARGRALAAAGYTILDSYDEEDGVCDKPISTDIPTLPVQELKAEVVDEMPEGFVSAENIETPWDKKTMDILQTQIQPTAPQEIPREMNQSEIAQSQMMSQPIMQDPMDIAQPQMAQPMVMQASMDMTMPQMPQPMVMPQMTMMQGNPFGNPFAN